MVLSFMYMYMTIMLFMLSLMMFMKSPLVLAVLVVALSCVTGIMMGQMMSSWFLYLSVLLYLGGMMILFIYVVSLSYSKIPVWEAGKMGLLASGFLSILFLKYYLGSSLKYSCFLKLSTLYDPSAVYILMFIGIYLVYVMLSCISLCQPWKGPMSMYF